MTPDAMSTLSLTAQKQRVALMSMLAAAAMTALKLIVGLLSGSLGVLSDAAHSGLDMIGAGLTFFSVRVSDLPADEDHTYGHGKVENLSSFGEVILMAASSAWIIWEGIKRITFHSVEIKNPEWPMLVVLCSIGVDFWRARQLKKVAERTGSTALATDAFHFASDIYSSLAVLCGLVASWIGVRFSIAGLQYADPIAAILISLLILRLTLRIGDEAIGVLMDKIPAGTRSRLLREIERIPGVLGVEQARVRRAGAHYFADLTLALPRSYTFEHTNKLVSQATEAVNLILPNADVVIHTAPRKARAESIFDRVRAVAARHNVSVHEVSVQSLQGKLRVEQHLELDEKLPLREAHEFACALEAEILHETPEIDAVLTHLESQPSTIEQPEEKVAETRRLEQTLTATAAAIAEIIDVHDIQVRHRGDHFSISCHCSLPDDLTMERVHMAITTLEDRFKLVCPEVDRVFVHPEPSTDNLR
jgi:cation diffusion facilitator family transporter